jgi:hypothetical protein
MKDLMEGKKEAKGKGYHLSNQQAEEDAIKDIGRLFIPQSDHGVDAHRPPRGNVTGHGCHT